MSSSVSNTNSKKTNRSNSTLGLITNTKNPTDIISSLALTTTTTCTSSNINENGGGTSTVKQFLSTTDSTKIPLPSVNSNVNLNAKVKNKVGSNSVNLPSKLPTRILSPGSKPSNSVSGSNCKSNQFKPSVQRSKTILGIITRSASITSGNKVPITTTAKTTSTTATIFSPITTTTTVSAAITSPSSDRDQSVNVNLLLVKQAPPIPQVLRAKNEPIEESKRLPKFFPVILKPISCPIISSNAIVNPVSKSSSSSATSTRSTNLKSDKKFRASNDLSVPKSNSVCSKYYKCSPVFKPNSNTKSNSRASPKAKEKVLAAKEKKVIDIRPLALTLSSLRGGSLPIRSTYVLKKKKVKEETKKSRRWRSLSPEILRNTAPPLTSPKLVLVAKQKKGHDERKLSPVPGESQLNSKIVLQKNEENVVVKATGKGKEGNGKLSYNNDNNSELLLQQQQQHLHHQQQLQLQQQQQQQQLRHHHHLLQQPNRSYKYLMESRNSTQVVGRLGHGDLQGRRMEKNIYSEPRSMLNYSKPKFQSYRLVEMYDDDPGIMSEAETSSTGFRRGGKARSSLPVVRTPSKTLERPLGLVFLQYRTETKRALLPNEITSMDTVRALFVRSFSKQLTMEYLDALNTKIYIRDNTKDMFYELEDLTDIRDRSVLRLFEPNVNGNGSVPTWNDQDQYFSEPEFDTDYPTLHHIHKSKPQIKTPIYSYSLPRPTPRPFSPAQPHVNVNSQSLHRHQQPPQQNIMVQSSGGGAPPKPLRHHYNKTSTPSSPLYSPRSSGNSFLGIRTSGSMGGVMDIYSTAADAYTTPPEKLYDNYNLAVQQQQQQQQPRSGSLTPVLIDEESRIRMEHMERQLANLTGLVQKAILSPSPMEVKTYVTSGSSTPSTRLYNNPQRLNYRDYIPTRDFIRDDIDKQSSSSSASLQDDPIIRPEVIIPTPQAPISTNPRVQKFGKEKSVSFSDDPPELQSSSGHRILGSQNSSEIKPSKPAIKSSTLPRVNQALSTVPVPTTQQQQPKKLPLNQITTVSKPGQATHSEYFRTDLSPELFNQLRNLQKKAKELKVDVRVLRRHVQAQTHALKDSLRETFLKFKVVATLEEDWIGLKEPRMRREEEMYKLEVNKLDKDITDLEQTVEDLRSHVINKRMRVNMSDVENMALVLSKSSKSVADLKARFPMIQENVARAVRLAGLEMEIIRGEPDRLEGALRRCKKLTGTLVTLKRLASVQEQRLPVSLDSGISFQQQQQSQQDVIVDSTKNSNRTKQGGGADTNLQNETLDDLLDELKLSKAPTTSTTTHRLHPPSPPKRLPSYPSTESGGGSPVHPPTHHPPVPPKPTKIPPPPPPRSSSQQLTKTLSPPTDNQPSSMSESSESVNSQDVGLTNRHLELLRKQRQLQEQFSRLQNLQHATATVSNNSSLKKTGSESNIRGRLSYASHEATGSLGSLGTGPNQLYETDIL